MITTSNFILPKEHFSWSQLDLWERDKNEYIRRYFYGKSGFTNKAMERGSAFSTAMETGESDDEVTKLILSIAPKYETMEEPIEATLNGIKLVGRKDTSKKDAFREYKTGRVEWTQKRADNHGQLRFYSLIDTLNGLKQPEIHLDWFPVQDGEFTGEIHSFEVKLKQVDVYDMRQRVLTAVEEISKEYQKALGSIADITKEDIAGTVFEKYANIEYAIKDLEEQKDKLKPEIEKELATRKEQKLFSDIGTFFFSVKKRWTYPKKIKKAEEALKIAKKDAEENGDAIFEENRALTFRKNENARNNN